MDLRFPKARLFAYDAILQGLSCSSVLATAIVDAGLLPQDLMSRAVRDWICDGSCQSERTAERILKLYMEMHHKPVEAKRRARAALAHFKADLDGWKRFRENTKTYSDHNKCRESAPVVLDLLLQQLQKH